MHSRISSSAAAQSKRFDIGDIPYVQRRRQSIYRGEGGEDGEGGNAGRTAAEGEFYNAPDGNPGQAIHREVDRCEQKSQVLSWEGLNSISSHYRLREPCLSKSSSQLGEITHPGIMANNFELHPSRLLARLRNF